MLLCQARNLAPIGECEGRSNNNQSLRVSGRQCRERGVGSRASGDGGHVRLNRKTLSTLNFSALRFADRWRSLSLAGR
jgi:hypothetical protein